jgi:biopolymer transport protein ExbD
MPMKGFDKDDLHAPNSEINTTPLVDVMLVLMVIFLVTAPVLEKATNINLPKERGTMANTNKDSITITVTASGEYYINDAVIPPNELQTKLTMLKNQNGNSEVSIKADAKTSHENVMKALGCASRSGFSTINFVSLE